MFHITLDSPVRDSFRVEQIVGMFDMPIERAARLELDVELPAADESWTIGAIVGPSGSGKTTVAREVFGLTRLAHRWPRDRAVIDAFGRLPIRRVLALFAAAGFHSPPAWLRPYHLLSTGERFRCDLARILAADQVMLVLDEFTSHLDRDTARSASYALQRFLRREAGFHAERDRLKTCPARLVAVMCQQDVLPWLAPDWVLRLPGGSLDRTLLRKPRFPLRFGRCDRRLWDWFRPHHYLSGTLARGATCYAAWWEDRPAAFCAVLGQIGHACRKRITRLVVLPQFQGLGLGLQLAEHVCSLESARGLAVSIATSHPAVIAACRRSPRWRYLGVKRCGGTPQRIGRRRLRGSTGRIVAAFQFQLE